MLDRFLAWWCLIVHLHSLSNKVRQVAQTPSSSGFQPFPFTVVISAFCSTPAFCAGLPNPQFLHFDGLPMPLGCVFNFSPPKMDASMCFFLYRVMLQRILPRDTLRYHEKNSCPSYGSTVIYGALLFFRRKKSGFCCSPGDQTGLPREAARVSSRQAAQQPGGQGQKDHRAAATGTTMGGVKPWL